MDFGLLCSWFLQNGSLSVYVHCTDSSGLLAVGRITILCGSAGCLCLWMTGPLPARQTRGSNVEEQFEVPFNLTPVESSRLTTGWARRFEAYNYRVYG